MKPVTVILPTLAAIVVAFTSADATAAIKKCKDAQGRWHYGDYAAAECARSHSRVIEFNAGKAGKKVIDAPPTKEELEAQRTAKRKEEEEKKREAEQAAADKLLSQRYTHEDDIIYERNRKLKDLQASIDSGNATLDHLKGVLARAEKHAAEETKSGKGVSKNTQQTLDRARHQVERHTALIEQKLKEQEETKAYYDDALKRYLDMKRRRSSAAR